MDDELYTMGGIAGALRLQVKNGVPLSRSPYCHLEKCSAIVPSWNS